MAFDTWSSIPWEQPPALTSPSIALWHKSNVPYASEANALQNLEVWVPSAPERTPSPSLSEERKGLWLIYIHGGAWRDPLVDSSSFTSTVERLLECHADTLKSIAGIASVNYSLSPHPNHPTHPSPPDDPSRQAKHPDHITDVLTGLSYLQRKAGFGNDYVLAGHSCGATLAFQVAMNHSQYGAAAAALDVKKPRAILGLNGIYDLPDLISNPGPKHIHLSQLYEAFTRLAFGDDKKLWNEVSPCSVGDWSVEWPEGIRAVLVQSKDDSLVPYQQTEDMLERLRGSCSSDLKTEELEAGGDHNDLWKDGARLAEIMSIVVRSI